MSTSKNQKHESKASNQLEYDGADYEKELNKIKEMTIQLRKRNGLVCK